MSTVCVFYFLDFVWHDIVLTYVVCFSGWVILKQPTIPTKRNHAGFLAMAMPHVPGLVFQLDARVQVFVKTRMRLFMTMTKLSSDKAFLTRQKHSLP
eukprot:379252-Amphidinium_carterae.1